MPPTYILARDHLEQAVTILQGEDLKSRQLRLILERTITLMDEFRREEQPQHPNVLNFTSFRRTRHDAEG